MNFLKKNNRFDSLRNPTPPKQRREHRLSPSQLLHSQRLHSQRLHSQRLQSQFKKKTTNGLSSLKIKKKQQFDMNEEQFPSLDTITSTPTHTPTLTPTLTPTPTPISLPNFKEITKKEKKETSTASQKPSSPILMYPMDILTKENTIFKTTTNEKSWYRKYKERKLSNQINRDIRKMIKSNRELNYIYGDTTPFDYEKTYGHPYISPLSKDNINTRTSSHSHSLLLSRNHHHDELDEYDFNNESLTEKEEDDY